MIAIIIMLFNGFGLMNLLKDGMFDYLSMGVFWIAIILTLLSGIDYIIRNREIVMESI
jgi:CDP-diacylglycerol--glycerol-3-phosphate 3-phosphatidyltransferase